MTKLSQYFSLEELTDSQKAKELKIPNTPNQAELMALKNTAIQLDKIRHHLGRPIIVQSGFRSQAVNKAVGGSANSFHLKGQAVDIVCPQFGSPYEVCLAILELLKKDPSILIHELIHDIGPNGGNRWVHIAFPTAGQVAMNRIRTARPQKPVIRGGRSKVIYVPGVSKE